MATRPTVPTPEWATAGTTTAEPSGGKKSAGWAVNERPPAQWLNWLQNSAGQWIDYIADALGGVAVTDLQINAANPSATVPTIDVTTSADTAGTTYKLLFRFSLGATRKCRMYVGSSGSARRFVLVQNALWNGTAWTSDDTSGPSAGVGLRGGSATDVLDLLYHAAGAGTWADGAWAIGGFTTLNATTLHVTGNTDLDGTLNVDGDTTLNNVTLDNITATADITAQTMHVMAPHFYLDADVDIVHQPPASGQPWRTVQLALTDGVILNPPGYSIADVYDAIGGVISNPSDNLTIEYKMQMPRNTLQFDIGIAWNAPDGSSLNEYSVIRTTRATDTISNPANVEVLANETQFVFNTAVDAVNDNLPTPLTVTVDPFSEVYTLRVGLIAGNPLYAVSYRFRDPGPRNG